MLTVRRYADRHPRLVEGAFLVLLCTATGAQYDRGGPGLWPGLLLSTGACLSLLARHRRPRPVVACTGFCAAVSAALGYPVTVLLLLPVLVAMYALTVRAPRRTAHLFCAAVVAPVVLAALVSDRNHENWGDKTVVPAFWITASVVQGSAVRARRAYLDAVRARAEHAERTREAEARHRVAEERVRIARELHDVVAHHMALAHAQAGTAAHLARGHPDQAERILGELTGTTSAALRELQATVGLLRHPDAPEDVREPAPGLARLPELVAAFASAGLEVVVTVDGEERPLPPGADLTAFRIVQEALTNVAKHAGAATARVRLAYTRDRLTLTVRDHGGAAPRPPAPGGGFGVIGMRERARSAGGHLHAGPHPEGGYAVTAELPFHRGPREGP
ncbi:two-component sensor histidine kinase [Streptomyces longispororuber]|uniref:histidine kinase n=1 Tax=Streptomyces longispororuber TaxID=68230 RepID=A0A918ZU94_9ACTN|nr:sensor histidine kinase [Streptomyces longispororuber]GHE70315.1 two-component sensor histidine kinase [Streptomyces longispororuber]